jgi:hypothetical protein
MKSTILTANHSGFDALHDSHNVKPSIMVLKEQESSSSGLVPHGQSHDRIVTPNHSSGSEDETNEVMRISNKKRKTRASETKQNSTKRSKKSYDAGVSDEVECSYAQEGEIVAIAMKKAKARGLPDGWILRCNEGKKLWISPLGKKCYSLPQALTAAGVKEQKQQNRSLTPEEVTVALREAKARGLPDGWGVLYSNEWRKKVWISPDGRKCASLPEALVVAGVKSYANRKLSSEERAASLQEAKSKGLPDGWNVEWNKRRTSKVWISSEGKKSYSLTQALVAAGVQSTPNRVFTPMQKATFLKEAKKKGLPDGWTVEYDNKRRAKVWISPSGKKCLSIPDALIEAGVKEARPQAYRTLTPVEVKRTLEDAKAKGLPSGWTVEWDNKFGQRLWISPDHKKFLGVKKALVYAGIAERKEYRKLTSEEVAEALSKAKAQGLPDGWSVEWNNKWGQKEWISPDGKRSRSLKKALVQARLSSPLTSYVNQTRNDTTKLVNFRIGDDAGIKQKDFCSPTSSSSFSHSTQPKSVGSSKVEAKCTQEYLSSVWTAKWDDRNTCFEWVSPDKKKEKSCAEAMEIAHRYDILSKAFEKSRSLKRPDCHENRHGALLSSEIKLHSTLASESGVRPSGAASVLQKRRENEKPSPLQDASPVEMKTPDTSQFTKDEEVLLDIDLTSVYTTPFSRSSTEKSEDHEEVYDQHFSIITPNSVLQPPGISKIEKEDPGQSQLLNFEEEEALYTTLPEMPSFLENYYNMDGLSA